MIIDFPTRDTFYSSLKQLTLVRHIYNTEMYRTLKHPSLSNISDKQISDKENSNLTWQVSVYERDQNLLKNLYDSILITHYKEQKYLVSQILTICCLYTISNWMSYLQPLLPPTYLRLINNSNMNTQIIPYLLLVLFAHTKLVFYDQFNSLDFRKWRHDLTLGGGGNNQFQMYINNRSVTYTKNSILYIQPVPLDQKIGANNVRNNSDYQIWGGTPGDFCTGPYNNGCKRSSNGVQYLNPIMSGKLTTSQSFTFTYGRVQVRAKLPKGDWLWPAIWLMPRYFEYGDWPASGQIDIMQSRGNVGYPRQSGGGPETFGSTIHWGPDWTTNQFWKTRAEYTINGTTLADDFHTYGLYWDDKQLYTYLDDDKNRVLVVDHQNISYWQRSQLAGSGRMNPWQYSPNKCAPFDRQFYLILNVAVGGTIGYFQDGVANKPWSDKSSRPSAEFYDNKGQWLPTWKKGDSAMQVDYVKVWDLSQNEQIIIQ